ARLLNSKMILIEGEALRRTADYRGQQIGVAAREQGFIAQQVGVRRQHDRSLADAAGDYGALSQRLPVFVRMVEIKERLARRQFFVLRWISQTHAPPLLDDRSVGFRFGLVPHRLQRKDEPGPAPYDCFEAFQFFVTGKLEYLRMDARVKHNALRVLQQVERL